MIVLSLHCDSLLGSFYQYIEFYLLLFGPIQQLEQINFTFLMQISAVDFELMILFYCYFY